MGVVLAHYHTESIAYDRWQSDVSKDRDNIRAAKEMGLNGFVLNVFSAEQADGQFQALIAAADAVGAEDFKFALSADMSQGFTAAGIRDTMLKKWSTNPHYLRVKGKPLLSTFGAEQHDNAWWQNNVIGRLASAGAPVTFIPDFDRPDPNSDDPSYDNWLSVIDRYPVADGLFNFILPASPPFRSNDPRLGRHYWSLLEGRENLAQALRDRGKLFMAEVKPYYWAACSSARQFIEFQGGRGIENQWRSIIEKQKPAIVQLVTWNDHGESTHYQPSRYLPITLQDCRIQVQPHLGFYELTKYFIQWYRSGTRPTITRDAVFAFYRTTKKNIVPTDDGMHCDIEFDPEQLWGDVQDRLYITTALTAPAELRVKTGSSPVRTFLVGAGMVHPIDVPFSTGTQTFELWRNGVMIAALVGTPINTKPEAYNFHVYGGYAVRGGSNSNFWILSDKWKAGYVADWFWP